MALLGHLFTSPHRPHPKPMPPVRGPQVLPMRYRRMRGRRRNRRISHHVPTVDCAGEAMSPRGCYSNDGGIVQGGESCCSLSPFRRSETPAPRRKTAAAPARTSDASCPGSSRCASPSHSAASAFSTFGSVPLVLAPPMNNVGVLIASASALENGGRWSRICPISVVALSRKSCFGRRRQTLPCAGAFQRVHEDLQAAIDVTLGDHLGGSRDHSGQRRGAGLVDGIERGRLSPCCRARPGSACATGPAAAARRESRCVRHGNGPSGRPACYRAFR